MHTSYGIHVEVRDRVNRSQVCPSTLWARGLLHIFKLSNKYVYLLSASLSLFVVVFVCNSDILVDVEILDLKDYYFGVGMKYSRDVCLAWSGLGIGSVALL